MKIASFKAGPTATYGLVTNAGIIDAGKRLKEWPTLKALLANGSLDALSALQSERPDYAFAEIELLPTVPDPDKIFCIGVNYATHLAESGHPTPPHPMIFTRFANSQVGGGQPMIRPQESERFDYEGEMAVIIGKAGRRISREAALAHVAGYACYNDGSIRDWQRHTSQFAPGKNFVGTGGFGPWMVTTDEIPDISKQTIVDPPERRRGTGCADFGPRVRRPCPDRLLLDLYRARPRRRHRDRHHRWRRRLPHAAALDEGWRRRRSRGLRHRGAPQSRQG